MRHERLWWAAAVFLGVLIAAGVVVTVLQLSPWVEVPWYWQILREPVMAGLYAAGALALCSWRWTAPTHTAFRVGRALGREDAERDRAPLAQVLPMPRRESTPF